MPTVAVAACWWIIEIVEAAAEPPLGLGWIVDVWSSGVESCGMRLRNYEVAVGALLGFVVEAGFQA